MTLSQGPVVGDVGQGGPPPRPAESIPQAYELIEDAGCCVLTDALSEAERGAILDRLRDQAAAENQLGVSSRYLTFAHKSRADDGPNQRVWNLISKGDVFRDLALNPLAREITEHFLGPDRLLSNMSGNISGPGCKPLHLHTDQGYIMGRVSGVASITFIWMLTDFTAANGATRVVPQSHRQEWDAPPEGQDIIAEAPAGSVLIMDGRTLHGTCANTTGGYRYGIVAHYVLPFVRQQENFGVSLDDETEAALSPGLRRLLGFEVWKTLGAVATPQEQDVVRRRYERVGYLEPRNALAGHRTAPGRASHDL